MQPHKSLLRFGLLLVAGTFPACGDAGEANRICSDLPPAMIDLEGGVFTLGSESGYADEAPLREVSVAPFSLSRFELTVGEFDAFVRATGYETEAEREGGSALFAVPTPSRRSWWMWSDGTSWQNPLGDGTAPDAREPVRHLRDSDVRTYADWAGLRLPTEVEWEYAAKAGALDPGQPGPGGANSHQGAFPLQDSAEDGFAGVAPVGCYAPNDFGFYDMVGNVWEMTSTPHARTGSLVIKGGSYLCSDSYCRRDRPASREAQELDMSTSHVGVRLARNIDD